MRVDDDPERFAASLTYDILVTEAIGESRVDVDWIRSDDQIRVMGAEHSGRLDDRVRDGGVLIVAIDGWSDTAVATRRLAADTDGFVVAVCGARQAESIDPVVLGEIREAVDTTFIAFRPRQREDIPPDHDDALARTRPFQSSVAVSGAMDFVRMIHEPGQINLDLADARTVLSDGSLAVLARGTASLERADARDAVRRLFEALPQPIDTTGGSDALVSVVGGPDLSLDDAVATVRTVREEVETIEEVIWGVATDDALTDRMTIDIVIDDVAYRPPLSGGDPCRRCGTALTAYTLGEQTTLFCETCGFADLSMSLRD